MRQQLILYKVRYRDYCNISFIHTSSLLILPIKYFGIHSYSVGLINSTLALQPEYLANIHAQKINCFIKQIKYSSKILFPSELITNFPLRKGR